MKYFVRQAPLSSLFFINASLCRIIQKTVTKNAEHSSDP